MSIEPVLSTNDKQDDLKIMQIYKDFFQCFDLGQALTDLIDPNPYGFIKCEYDKEKFENINAITQNIK
jgi:hypothetical protein